GRVRGDVSCDRRPFFPALNSCRSGGTDCRFPTRPSGRLTRTCRTRCKFMPITLLDGILVGFTLVSAMLAMVRGFSREILSIASWAAAAAAAFFLYPAVLPYVQPHIDNEQVAMIAAAAAVFIVALIVVT